MTEAIRLPCGGREPPHAKPKGNIMCNGGGAFSPEEVEYLRSLPVVAEATSRRITYTESFKHNCMRRYHAGESPVELFREAGLDPSLIGYKRIERCFARWRKIACRMGTDRLVSVDGNGGVVVGFILMYIVVKKESSLRLLGDESWKFDKDILKNVVNLSIPAGLERVTLSLAQVVMTGVVSSMGAVSVAINYVAVSAEGLCYLPAYGIGGAATTLVGQSIGAKRKDMAKRFAYLTTLLSFVLVIFMSVILFAFAPFLASTLTNSQEVIDGASECLRIVSFSEPLFAISIVVMGALRGAGDSKRPFVLNALSMWGMRVLPIIIFTKRYGAIGVWITMTFELVFRGILFFIRMVRGKWLNQNSIE